MSTSPHDISFYVDALRAGKLVAFPTETVYGLGGNALSDAAVAEIFARKGRPAFNPLIIHVADVDAAKNYVQWNDAADALAKHFWPGPLTFVLPRKEGCAVSLLASAGLETIAVRVPSHPLALELLRAVQLPIAAPSANRSGRISPTSSAHVREEFPDNLIILEGGSSEVGLESTVLDLIGKTPRILRPGAVTREEIQAVLGVQVQHHVAMDDTAPHSPGMLKSHYAPTTPLRLNAWSVKANEALLAFGPHVLKGAGLTLNLSEKGDVVEAAANLFAHLRTLDAAGYSSIAAMPVPLEGLGIAINDRLVRAAN